MKGVWKALATKGLTRQILTWFLLISLVPLGLVCWISTKEAQTQLHRHAEQSLRTRMEIQLAALKAGFDKMKVDILQESDRVVNSRFLSALAQSYSNSKKPLSQFVESYAWQNLKTWMASDLIAFWKEHPYADILLIDHSGNVLFTVTEKNVLGKNLFKGRLKDSRFSEAARQSLASGRVVFSDLEYFKPEDNILAGFLISPIVDEAGGKAGLMAFQIPGCYLAGLMMQEELSHPGGNQYIIGKDLCLRSPGSLGSAFPALTRPVETELSKQWIREHIQRQRHVDFKDERVLLYTGPLGRKVMGMHADIHLPGLQWAYIVETDAGTAFAASKRLARLTAFLIAGTGILIFLFTLFRTRRIVRPVTAISDALEKAGKGDFLQEITVKADHELANLVQGFNTMMKDLKAAQTTQQEQHWLQEGLNRLNRRMQGDLPIEDLGRNTVKFLCRYLNAQMGACYVADETCIRMVASFAFSTRKGFRNEFAPGEGIVGQAALERQSITVSPVPDDYVAVASGLGETPPTHISVVPMIWNETVVLLLEFATLKGFTPLQQQFLEMISPAVSVAAQTALSRHRTQQLLEKTQAQAEELAAREEELRDSNHLLEQQARDMEAKNEELNSQQEELRVANEELEEQTQNLKQSRSQVETKNRELEEIQGQLEQRANELSVSNKYKSEFLANMSHELRTPLNSLLILAKLLTDNKERNLTEKQIEYAGTIHDSGRELLHLINEILDLSKIEAGRMEIHMEEVLLTEFVTDIKRKFTPLAREKGLAFEIETDQAPEKWITDSQKFGQVIRNLLSNAFKFTSKGHVRLFIGAPAPEAFDAAQAPPPGHELIISVSDTGIGIPKTKMDNIFEAFEQADGTTSRKYGGTGLGLTISRELVRLLGGKLHVQSIEGKGSTFTFYIPVKPPESAAPPSPADPPETGPKVPRKGTAPLAPVEIDTRVADDRKKITPGERCILIIEDDLRFVELMAELTRSRGFKVLLAQDGEAGIHLADYFQPSGIVLDIGLPGMDGWEVMDHLKENPRTRHIPVHFITAGDAVRKALNKGAVGFLQKPVTMEGMQDALSRIEHVADTPVKRLLIVEDDKHLQKALCELLDGEDVAIETAATAALAKERITQTLFDCIVLDIGLPDMDGLQLIETLNRTNPSLSKVPVIIYTGRELEPRERAALDKYAQRLIIKSVHSEERLLDDTTLFLHRLESAMPESQQQILRMLHNRESVFEKKKVLLADDDMRNVFALSAVLQEKRMAVTVAKDGKEALEKLDARPDTDIVLMDIMMPEMDGYEAMEQIRGQHRFRDLPVIALTAKAMKGDRSKCIDAGASDYLAKPVDTDKLLSMMRVWLCRK